MTNIAYFDCFHGAAGDMLLASLLDAGLPLAELEQVLAALPLRGYRLQWQRVVSRGVGGSRLRVVLDEAQPSRNWREIRAMLEEATLPARSKAWALGAFGRLAQVEAAIHGVAIDAVHFHEVGAVDSIVDTVGVCAGLELLGVEQVYASALPLGRGWVKTQHGMLPVPAPATLRLLAEVGAPILPPPADGELLTPTAAALLAELATFGQPPMQLHGHGYGFGQKEFERLNGLRVWLGTGKNAETQRHRDAEVLEADHVHDHTHDHPHDHDHSHSSLVTGHSSLETVVELRCNLDDATGETIAYAIERLLAAGALDAWATPLTMKKGRPALQLACLAPPAQVDMLARLILRETPTLGVRWQAMERMAAGRAVVEVGTPWGWVRLKQKLLDGAVVASSPEYDDCAALARAHGVPLAEVYAAALAASYAEGDPHETSLHRGDGAPTG